MYLGKKIQFKGKTVHSTYNSIGIPLSDVQNNNLKGKAIRK
jgi:hypothetical protein